MSILQVTEKETQLQRELDEERRLNSMGAEREYILLGKIAQLERSVEKLREALNGAVQLAYEGLRFNPYTPEYRKAIEALNETQR